MEYEYLNNINYPSDLKKLPREALPRVCDELRDFIINELSHNPGHLGSSLGTIELTVALHYVFDTPNDRLIWDVGHQAYAHKILTGRRTRFSTNRQLGGLSPFPSPDESEYDAFISGHASNSISAALGEQIADNMQGENRQVVAVIGDGAMTGGLAFEGLNNMSMFRNNLLVVLNDNNMAIDPIKGGFTQYLVDLTTSAGYNKLRYKLYLIAKRLHLIDEHKKASVQRFNNSLKASLTHQPKNIFQGLNLRYFGPADGQDVLNLVRILQEIKNHKGPRVLHIVTTKGYGYPPAMQDQTVWHAPGEFNVKSGERVSHSTAGESPLWQQVFGETLLELAKEDKRVVGVTPAMPSGCSMNIMQHELPERVFDVGIAEGHAVTFSAGMAKEGLVPYCNVYSSFLQRSYDNIIHDVALPRLHVVLCIDRAGIVGNDGATHHGLFDLAYLRPIPNIVIAAPMDREDLKKMMRFALRHSGPIAIRYPRGRTDAVIYGSDEPLELGHSRLIKPGSHSKEATIVLTIGSIGNTAYRAIEDTDIAMYDMRWLKPLDTALIDKLAELQTARIVTIEDGVIAGGLGSAVAEYVSDKGYNIKVERIGIHDTFVQHGSTKELYHLLGLDEQGLKDKILGLHKA